jgi:beta-glucosidase-like glycosyl hydrolase
MTTPERYDHHEEGMLVLPNGDYVSYDDYAFLRTRAEQAEAALKATLEREAETHRRHDARLDKLQTELEGVLDELSACKELGGCGYWRDRSKVREADLDDALARVKELEKAGRLAAQELRVIAGMDLIGASAVAFNAARALEAALSREEPKP